MWFISVPLLVLMLLVLAIRRGEEVLPSPSAAERIRPGDRLVCYGELARVYDFASAGPEKVAPETGGEGGGQEEP